MWQLVLAQVPVKGWVINPNEHGLLDGPGDALGFPLCYREIVQFYGMTCGIAVVIDGGGALTCSFNLSLKVLHVSPMYFSVHSGWSHHVPVHNTYLKLKEGTFEVELL